MSGARVSGACHTHNSQAANQGSIVRKNGEVPSRGDRAKEHVNGAALNSAIQACVVVACCLDVIRRGHFFIQERRQGVLGLQKMHLISNPGKDFLTNCADDGDPTLRNGFLKSNQHLLLIFTEQGYATAAEGE